VAGTPDGVGGADGADAPDAAGGRTAAFAHLLSPGRLGPLHLRNRLVQCPMGDSLAEGDGSVGERQRAFYAARARGGVGLVLVGSVGVSYPSGSFGPLQTAASHARYGPGLEALADDVHGHGALIAAQLVHDGANSRYDIARGEPLLVPSRLASRSPDRLTTMVTPGEATKLMWAFTQPTSKLGVREATDDDLAAVIDAFVRSARLVVDAGFDGIELHAGHGYLLDAFLSPASNHRTDRWGGDLDGRARLLLETIRAVRAEVGAEVGLWMRINAEERHTDGGETVADTVKVVALAEQAGIDAVHVSAHSNPMVAIGITDAHTPHEPGLLVPLVRAVKASAALPVIGYGRLEPDAAEELIASGGADFVAMGRKLLADADLPRKLGEGRADDVRPCIYQYRCIGNIFLGEPLGCVTAAATGHGDEAATPPARSPQHVLVAGGGPAGLEVARLLAESGHRVTLVERSGELGGRLRLAAACEPTMARLLAWSVRQVQRSDVKIVTGTAVDASVVVPRGAGGDVVDLVVDATGTAWPDIDALAPWLLATGHGDGDGPHGAEAGPGASVAILGGDRPALTLARELLRRGRHVTVVEPSGVFGQSLGLPGRFREVYELERAGGRLVTELPAEAFATVVDTARATPRPLALGVPVVRIGDVSGSAGIEAAFADARRLCAELAR
jgi:2,4-dienoyl-CoA reductase-like NADH-dependent reductase (Old Yellow Enzyme family)